MTLLCGSGFPLYAFKPSMYLNNGVPAVAEVVSGLSGNARLLSEWANGPITGVTPCAPSTPHGDGPGHDHSGGVMGTPLQVPIWTAWFGASSDAMTGDLVLGEGPRASVTAANDTVSIIDNKLCCCWVPGCAPDGAYRSLELVLSVYATAACNVTVNWLCNGQVSEQTEATVATTYRQLRYDYRVPVSVGQLQQVSFAVYAVRIADDASCTLCSASLWQSLTAP